MMIIKKKKAVLSAILATAMTLTAVMPTVSAASNEKETRTKAEKYGDETYVQRFLSLYDDVITNGQENGYLSKNNVASGGFGVPYHCVEELNVEAPDYGHETTSEAMSYIVWMAAMRDFIGKEVDSVTVDGASVTVEDTSDLSKAWETMKIMIPTVQEGFMSKTELSAQYAPEQDFPEKYPVDQQASNTGKNPIHSQYSNIYSSDGGLFLMHWLADVDDWYGFGGGNGKFTFINTFQRGAQESCWETVPHPCVEELKYGMSGTRGMKGIFSKDAQVAKQWAYTNAPDAEDRAIQGVYAAQRWGVAPANIVAEAGKMGDQLRNNMFDKYYKTIGCTNENEAQGNGYAGAHYLMSWYTSWGGAMDGQWAWQIGASHCHEFYQNPLAAYALLADEGLKAGMKTGTQAVKDYEISLQRQLEFYLWLQSEQGPIAGGATSSWHGRYLPYEYLADVDADYIAKYNTNKPTTFYKMGYQEHPVYADPGSNHWIGNQVWAIQRLAEMYYVVKTNPTDVSNTIKAGGLSMEDALAKILDRWVEWFVENGIELTADGDYSICATLNWSGQPKDWSGTYEEHTGVSCEIGGWGNADFGCIASLCNTLIYYAKANGVETEAAYSSKNTDVASKALYYAHALLDRTWDWGRDNIGLTRSDSNGSMYRLFEQEVWVPSDYTGTMPNGETIANGQTTFYSIRTKYDSIPKFQEFKTAYDAYRAQYPNAEVSTDLKDEATIKAREDAMKSVELKYHRFWHAGDYLLALGTMWELYPDLEADKYDDSVEPTDPTEPSTEDSSNVPTGSLNPDDYLYGDVDVNGAVELADLTTLGKYLLNNTIFPLVGESGNDAETAMEQADTKYDGEISSADSSLLSEYILEKIDMTDMGPKGVK